MLKDKTGAAFTRRNSEPIEISKADGPVVGKFQPAQNPQERRLAGARRTEKRDEGALRRGEAYTVESGVGAKAFPDGIDRERHFFLSDDGRLRSRPHTAIPGEI